MFRHTHGHGSIVSTADSFGRCYDADMSTAAREPSRRGPLFWVLSGGVVFLVLLFGGLLLMAYIAGNRFDAIESLRTMVRADKDNEILEEDPEARVLHFRNKKTGKEFIYRIDPNTHQVNVLPVEPAPKAPGK